LRKEVFFLFLSPRTLGDLRTEIKGRVFPQKKRRKDRFCGIRKKVESKSKTDFLIVLTEKRKEGLPPGSIFCFVGKEKKKAGSRPSRISLFLFPAATCREEKGSLLCHCELL